MRGRRVRGLFRDLFGGEPASVWHAPGRVNLIGEHTDYNDGFVLPFALPLGVLAAVGPAPGGVLRLASAQHPGTPVEVSPDELRPGRVTGWAAYPAGVVWALRRAGLPVEGLKLLLDGKLPAGAGLSSSAAVECAVGMAVDELYGLGLGRARIAALARSAEAEFVGMPCGPMDQHASLMCTRGHALLLDTRSLVHEQVPLDFAADGSALLLVDTGSTHRLVTGEYATRRRDCEAAAIELGVPSLREICPAELPDALRRLGSERLRSRVRHVVTENERVVRVAERLRAGRPSAIGELLTASHESLRVDYQVSGPQLDLAVATALRAGALGARMTGGGFGGSVIALAAGQALQRMVDEMLAAFARVGLPAPSCASVAPAAGASRA